MVFLPASLLLLLLGIAFSWLNKVERPIKANRIPIVLSIGLAIYLWWLIELQRSIGCPTMVGECYVQHEDLEILQFYKLVFGATSYVFMFYLAVLSLLRSFRLHKMAFKGSRS